MFAQNLSEVWTYQKGKFYKIFMLLLLSEKSEQYLKCCYRHVKEMKAH